ncbi:MAG: histidine phosphatase family protein [Pseudomonadota bacterium]
MSTPASPTGWWVWRHPRPQGTEGRCVGRHDLPVDPRRAKRLARRIQRVARREGLPRVVWTSSLQRAHAVGEFLARWGWQHRVDDDLQEAGFGTWEGRRWCDIPRAAIDAWCADFAGHPPGGGESLKALFTRCQGALANPVRPPVCVIVGHAGWMSAAHHLVQGQPLPAHAADWPAPVPYGGLRVLPRPGDNSDRRLSAETPMPATIRANATA